MLEDLFMKYEETKEERENIRVEITEKIKETISDILKDIKKLDTDTFIEDLEKIFGDFETTVYSKEKYNLSDGNYLYAINYPIETDFSYHDIMVNITTDKENNVINYVVSALP